jgi:hypothetical protein
VFYTLPNECLAATASILAGLTLVGNGDAMHRFHVREYQRLGIWVKIGGGCVIEKDRSLKSQSQDNDCGRDQNDLNKLLLYAA